MRAVDADVVICYGSSIVREEQQTDTTRNQHTYRKNTEGKKYKSIRSNGDVHTLQVQ